MQLFTRYAVFLSVVGHFLELFRHCDEPNVSVHLWSCRNSELLFDHSTDTFFPLCSLVSAVPGLAKSPIGLALESK